MTYETDYRIAALSFLESGGSKAEAARIFKVSRDTLYRWLKLDDVAPKAPLGLRHRKIDKRSLKAHVDRWPDVFVHERAAHFGVHPSSMSRALSKLNIRKKKSADI